MLNAINDLSSEKKSITGVFQFVSLLKERLQALLVLNFH